MKRLILLSTANQVNQAYATAAMKVAVIAAAVLVAIGFVALR
jgi:hypothetical protein